MLTLVTLLFYFLVALTIVTMVVLLLMAQRKEIKAGYTVFLFSYLGWLWLMNTLPTGSVAAFWIYGLPLIWLVLLFRFGFPKTNGQDMAPQLGEPRYTQEFIRGEAGTREALTFYFLLLLIGLIILQFVLYLANSRSW